jgi:hypothetical protein
MQINNIDPSTGKPKIIIHACADIGSDSEPYRKAGYNVICVGSDIGVENYNPPDNVYGIIANPPCTEFAGSGARWWEEKGLEPLLGAIKIVTHCMRIIAMCQDLKFWVLENPVGRLKDFLGKPQHYYQPYEYGDTYSKKTCLWGRFIMPEKHPVIPTEKDKIWKLPPTPDRADLRSICSEKFAQAFFEANQ